MSDQKMQNVPPQPKVSAAEHYLARIAQINPEYKPLTDALQPQAGYVIAAVSSIHTDGNLFVALRERYPEVAKVIQEFCATRGGSINAEQATRVLFGFHHN